MRIRGRFVILLMTVSLIAGGVLTYFALPLIASPRNGIPMVLQSGKGDTTNSVEKINSALKLIENQYVEDIGENTLVEGAIQGMIDKLEDPYSAYMNVKTANQFNESLESTFDGIGAEVSMVNGKVTIVAPFKGSPAEKAGLKPNDQIIKVDNESIAGLELYEAVLKIRGKKGTIVTLEVQRPELTKPISVKVTRDAIPIETVYSSVQKYQGNNVGYIEITSFSEDTAKSFEKHLKELEDKGIKGLVIDVRGNPGGYLESVKDISRLLIPKDKPYVQIENRNGEKERIFTTLKDKKDYPIVGLIDQGSASASEILAGALKEGAGYDLVGEKTYGKGTVQQAIPFEDGSQLKLTLFKWLTPDGNWIHKKGIAPTIEAKQPDYFYTSPLQVEKALKFDDNNEKVESAQKMLKGLGFEPGRIDGYFSKETQTAVQAFQRTYHLPVSGEIDLQTAGKLESSILEKIRDEENDQQLKVAIKSLFE